MKKVMLNIIVFTLIVSLTGFTEIYAHRNVAEQHHKVEYLDKSEAQKLCNNIPEKHIDVLCQSNLSYEELKNINDQIKDYYLSDSEIEKYIDKITNNGGRYPRDKDGNTITPNGIIPYQDITLQWKDVNIGDVRGKFIRWNHFYVKIHDKKTAKTCYIPVYEAGVHQSFCIEDLTNCGFSHSWDAKTKTTHMNYDGTTYSGLSKHNKTAGNIYHSDVKTYINGESIFSYNIGGYSLAEVNALRKIVRENMTIEVISSNDENLVKLDHSSSTNKHDNTKQNAKKYTNRGNTVKVSIPTFKVTLNGTTMDSEYNKYPCIVYNDITYFPMTYDYSRFLGLKANWYEHTKRDARGVLFIGVCHRDERQLKLNTITTTKKNKRHYTANLADYGLLINRLGYHDLINNKEEDYPILNFRGITYFPLTWKYAVDEFGWKYAFDNEYGLSIDCADPFKPVIDDTPIGFSMPHLPKERYVYGDDFYLVIPHSVYAPVANLVYRKRGEEERVYNITDQLYNGKYAVVYLNMEKFFTDDGAVGFKESTPVIDGNILSLKCKGYKREDDPKEPISEEILMKIDLDTGQILSEEIAE